MDGIPSLEDVDEVVNLFHTIMLLDKETEFRRNLKARIGKDKSTDIFYTLKQLIYVKFEAEEQYQRHLEAFKNEIRPENEITPENLVITREELRKIIDAMPPPPAAPPSSPASPVASQAYFGPQANQLERGGRRKTRRSRTQRKRKTRGRRHQRRH